MATPANVISDSDSDGEYCKYWINWFLNTKGNEFFCDIDEEYIMDRFNLTGLPAEVPHFQQAMELITDELDENNYTEEEFNDFYRSAKHLYGLIHARYILTNRGLMKMLEKFKNSDFGRCPRIYCSQSSVLPIGVTDVPGESPVRLYCPRCEDVYIPKSSRHNAIDGAYFGTSFCQMLIQTYPVLKEMNPEPVLRHVPKIFGFKIHKYAQLHRWQDRQRELQAERLKTPI
ncbi:Casein kinase II subunit beta [Smittium culicis]|uniref:Casein kinase II subunit beta n=1 Tax=Smittium culicis TaxID=133412 RepID=A0A1R1XGJ5_9FUNG|nr:Casein kinase II subunit beta [Smittium culicis]